MTHCTVSYTLNNYANCSTQREREPPCEHRLKWKLTELVLPPGNHVAMATVLPREE